MKMNKNDLFYFCSVIEYIGRVTNNHRKDIVSKLTDEDIKHEFESASVNHCLSFEQICDEWIEKYGIQKGNYDCISNCKYKVPSYTAIGKIYQRLILDTLSNDELWIQTIRNVFNSFIIDEITYFNSNVYYSNPDYIRCCYLEGKLLD